MFESSNWPHITNLDSHCIKRHVFIRGRQWEETDYYGDSVEKIKRDISKLKSKEAQNRLRKELENQIFSKAKPGYWAWAEKHSPVEDGLIIEDPLANADVVEDTNNDPDTYYEREFLKEEKKAGMKKIDKVLKLLPVKQKEAWLLMGRYGLSSRKAAKELGISKNAVQQRFRNAEMAIKTHLNIEQKNGCPDVSSIVESNKQNTVTKLDELLNDLCKNWPKEQVADKWLEAIKSMTVRDAENLFIPASQEKAAA